MRRKGRGSGHPQHTSEVVTHVYVCEPTASGTDISAASMLDELVQRVPVSVECSLTASHWAQAFIFMYVLKLSLGNIEAASYATTVQEHAPTCNPRTKHLGTLVLSLCVAWTVVATRANADVGQYVVSRLQVREG